MAKILVVDDEAPIVDAISYNLRKEGYSVDSAADADECLSRVRADRPDLVVLDVMLPSGSGLDVCRRLQREVSVPVLLLTARAAETDCLKGFEAGADDYVIKPFSMRELLARVRTLLRRYAAPAAPARENGPARPSSLDSFQPQVLMLDDLSIDPERREVKRDGTAVALSRKEFDLLTLMASYKGRVFDRQTLLSRIWGEDCYVDDRTVDVHIRWLREKLERTPAKPEMLLTVRGVGYKFRG